MNTVETTSVSPHSSNAVLPAVLHLTLTKKWFDMIKSGEKKEEYRQDEMYWKNRFVKKGYWHSQTCKEFDIIRFKNGYAKDAPTMEVECKNIRLADLDEVNPNWFGSVQDYEGCRIYYFAWTCTVCKCIAGNDRALCQYRNLKN